MFVFDIVCLTLIYSLFLITGKKDDLIQRLENYDDLNAKYEEEESQYLSELKQENTKFRRIKGPKNYFSDNDENNENIRNKENVENSSNDNSLIDETENRETESGGKKRKLAGNGKNTFGLSLSLQSTEMMNRE